MVSSAPQVCENVLQWAIATTKNWETELRVEQQRAKHCRRSARYRIKKQGTQAAMMDQRRQLEVQLKERLALIETQLARDDGSGDESITARAIQRLALERRLLTTENQELREAIEKNAYFQRMMQSECFQILDQLDSKSRERVRDSRWTPAPPTTEEDEKGWRVHLVNEEPSFYFQPFTRNEYDAILKGCDDTLAFEPPLIEAVGSLFGWAVHHAPLTRRADNSLVAHGRFTRRVHCSLEDADKMLLSLDIDTWPLVVTPPAWGYRQREQTCCQVLQEFDTDAYVLIRDIPGAMHFRYINLARRSVLKLENGRRMATYVTVIANSKDNARSRSAEQTEDRIHWVREGGTYIKFTEVDETTIDVSYDHWGSCHDELHAQHLFVRWTQFAVQLQQWVLPSHLLSS